MRRRKPDHRPSAAERGYGSAWAKARAGFLRHHPNCAECAKEGLIVRASVVDHIVPHRGDQRLFWDTSNWQPLCISHHSIDKQQREKSGFSTRVLASGLPSDPSHPFFAGPGDEPSEHESRQQPPQSRQRGSCQGVGGSEVDDRQGGGPIGGKRAELVSRSEPEGSSEGAAARPLPSCDRASGSALGLAPSIAAMPPSFRGSRNG